MMLAGLSETCGSSEFAIPNARAKININIEPTINGEREIRICPNTGIFGYPCFTSPPSFLNIEMLVTLAPVIKQVIACESS